MTSTRLADAWVRLAITAYDAETDTPKVYRTPHSPSGMLDRRRDRLDVAMATSAAPTYFEATRIENVLAVDGGVWANSPTTVALAEAAQLGWNLADVRMLSVGTLFTPNVLAQPVEIDANVVKALRQSSGVWLARRRRRSGPTSPCRERSAGCRRSPTSS